MVMHHVGSCNALKQTRKIICSVVLVILLILNTVTNTVVYITKIARYSAHLPPDKYIYCTRYLVVYNICSSLTILVADRASTGYIIGWLPFLRVVVAEQRK